MGEEVRPGRDGWGARYWLAGTIVAVVLVVLATAAILLVDREPEAQYPPGSAEAAFGDWARAWESGDVETAWAALTTSAREHTSPEAFRAANRRQSDVARRIWIDEVTADGERAVLYLSIETLVDEGLLGSGRERNDSRMTMSYEDDAWKVDTPTVAYGW